MRKLLLLSILLNISIVSFSQVYRLNVTDSERIKKDTCYYWYQGNGDFETVEDAERHPNQ